MRKMLPLFLFIAVSSSSASALTMRFPAFTETRTLRFSGDALAVNSDVGAVLRLTPADLSKSGSAFLTRRVSTVELHTAFSFRISDRGGIADCGGQENGADGVVFAIQNAGSGALGAAGGGLGFQGIPHSVGIEFDTFCNAVLHDPSPNHIGIDLNGHVDHGPGAPDTVSIDDRRFDDGTLHYVWIDYHDGTLEVRIATTSDRPDAASLARVVDVPTVIGSPTAFVGFTAGTGNAFATHDIVGWEVSDEEGGLAPHGSVNREAFAIALFDFMNLPDTPSHRKAFVAWMASESSSACQPHALRGEANGSCTLFDAAEEAKYCAVRKVKCRLRTPHDPSDDRCICDELPGHNDCRWNPINSTEPVVTPRFLQSEDCPGNTAHVQRYPTCLGGLFGTAKTLRGSNFREVLDLFRDKRSDFHTIVSVIADLPICGNVPPVKCPILEEVRKSLEQNNRTKADIAWQSYRSYSVYPAKHGTCMRQSNLSLRTPRLTGYDVLEVQYRLTSWAECKPNDINFASANQTGKFDPDTRAAVVAFGKVRAMDNDPPCRDRAPGVVGGCTWKALHDEPFDCSPD